MLVWKIQTYLTLNKFTIFTDSKALTLRRQFKGKNVHLLSWSLLLDSFNFDIVHTPGVSNQADSSQRPYLDITHMYNYSDKNVILAQTDQLNKSVQTGQTQLTFRYAHQLTYSPATDNIPSDHSDSPMTVSAAVMAINSSSIKEQQMASSDICHIYEYLANGELQCNKKLAFKTLAEAQQYIIEDGTELLYHLYTPHIRHLPRHERISKQLAVPENYKLDALQQ